MRGAGILKQVQLEPGLAFACDRLDGQNGLRKSSVKSR
jgi:hypothetical protein